LYSVSAAAFVYFTITIIINQVIADFLSAWIYASITVIAVYLAGCQWLDILFYNVAC
jgi:hypothetical protein